MNHIFHYFNFTKQKHYVYKSIAFDYAQESTGWMRDKNLPDSDTVYRPSLDVVEENGIFEFDKEEQAMEKLATEYGKQSKVIRDILSRAASCLKGESDSVLAEFLLVQQIEKFLQEN